ncbi:transcription elongation factor GreA, partial [Clostridium perfringens]
MNNYLTEENVRKLREELDYRMSVVRAKIAKEKLEAAAHGDRSENAEYKEACRNYRENDNRIQYLLTMISTAIIIDEESNDKSTLGLNSKARIKFVEDDDEDVVTLVTTMDLDLENMCISIESDLGKA